MEWTMILGVHLVTPMSKRLVVRHTCGKELLLPCLQLIKHSLKDREFGRVGENRKYRYFTKPVEIRKRLL